MVESRRQAAMSIQGAVTNKCKKGICQKKPLGPALAKRGNASVSAPRPTTRASTPRTGAEGRVCCVNQVTSHATM
jgi:hypothetical protein